MNLISVTKISKTYALKQVLQEVSFGLDTGQKIGLIGKNGSGKSTLLKLILNEDTPDSGQIQFNRKASLAYLPQEVFLNPDHSAIEEVLYSMQEEMQIRNQYEACLNSSRVEDLQNLDSLQFQMESRGIFSLEARIRKALKEIGLAEPDRQCLHFSGGEQKKIALVKALMKPVDCLILDEPTNHLDTDSIDWLEEKLQEIASSLLLITHDRYFLSRVVDRIAELDSGKLTMFQGNYTKYLESKAHQLEVEGRTHKNQISFLQRELSWVVKQPRARGTKAKYRLDQYEEVKSNLSFRPKPMEEFQFSMSKPAGNLIVEWGQLTKAYRQPLFCDFSYKVLEGEKIGVIGPNGAGKSTFFKVLLEQEKPDQGYVSWGSSTKICYWDQSRTLLKDDCTVLENFAEFGERISFGETNPHVIGYLERFLFQRGDLDKKVGKLSGGERARLILARLVAMKGNFLILDEPTNDLDLDTMRLLEEALIAYPGNALMVSHDRYFLDRVCTTVIEIGHSPIPMVSAGNYSLFQLFKSRMRQEEVLSSPAEKTQNREKAQNKPAKLNYRQNQRLLELEHLIADLEKQKSLLENQLQEGSLDYLSLQAKSHQLQELEKSLESLMNEWIQLMELKA